MKNYVRYASKAALVSMLAVVLVISGCWTAQQWFTLVGALLPIIGQTYIQFSGFASGHPTSAAEVALVQGLTSAGQDAITRTEAIIAAVKAGDQSRLGELKTVLSQLQQNVNGFLADAQIKNSANFAEYSGYAQAILADVSDVIALIPVIVPAPVVAAAKAGGRTSTVTMSVSYGKAKGLPGVFSERLARLPK